MIKIFIFGITGKIGKSLINFIKLNNNFLLIGGICKLNLKFLNKKKYKKIFYNMNKNGLIVDFSKPDLIKIILSISIKYKIPLIIGTTGFCFNKLNLIKKFSNIIPILISYNMSVGINIINYFLSNINFYLYKYNFDTLILDFHHNKKLDNPSGTSLMLYNKIKKNLKIFSARIKNIIGMHIIYIISNYEIIKIEHYVNNRKIFILGIIYAIYWIIKKNRGCYSMHDVFFK